MSGREVIKFQPAVEREPAAWAEAISVAPGCPTSLRFVMSWHPDPATRRELRLRAEAGEQVREGRGGA